MASAKLQRFIRFSLLVAISILVAASTILPAATFAQSDLPVPREETIFLEDTPGPFTIFDSFNTRIPNGNQFANGFFQIGMEYLFLANFATGEIIPWLAESYEYNDDYTELTIRLKDYVHWNDGVPFTAEDVVFTINTILPNEALGEAAIREFVAEASAPDATTVVLKLTKPGPRFIYQFFGQVTGFVIWPKHIWENQDPMTFKNNPPVTTSVWKLKDVNVDLRMFIWERDENYWDKDNRFPEAKYVIYRNAPNSPDADYQEFVANTIDHAHNIQWFQIEQAAAENPAVTYAPFQDPCPRGIWINTQRYPLSLPEFRWALSYLVNRPKIANVIWQPPTVPATHPWSDWALLQQYIDPAVIAERPIEYSPEKAVAILDELGFAPGPDGIRVDDRGNPLSFVIGTPVEIGGGEYQIAQDLSEEAAKVGIRLEVKYLAGNTYWTPLETGDFDLGSHWLCGSGFMDPLGLYQNYTSDLPIPGDGSNLSSYNNFIGLQDPAFDEAVERIKVNGPDTEAGKAAYMDAFREWMRLMPVMPIVQTIYVMSWNQTYWTNWPTEDNMYTVPFTWWATFLPVTFNLKSA
jgi:peptide/nickel transport system substrate-binding protein